MGQTSKYYISHLSDILRVLIVKKFGGIYLDLDALILKPLPPAPNFVGRENDDYVAGGLIKFQKNHPLGLLNLLIIIDYNTYTKIDFQIRCDQL